MARTVRDTNLETRAARDRLKPSGAPYYRGIDQGLHIGYRKGKSGGVWVMRWRTPDNVYKVESLAKADDIADADGTIVLNFSQAQAKARDNRVAFERAAKGLSNDGPYTVRACIAEYLTYLEHERKSADDARYRADALILPTLGDVICAELTKAQIDDWKNKAAATPPRLRTRQGQAQRYRDVADDDDEQKRRRRATVNRSLTALKAALNRAWRDGKLSDDSAWRRVKPFGDVDAARVRYLTIDECRCLINSCEGVFRDLVRAALATGCRYGELARLEVQDFNPDSGTLHIRTSKSGKVRYVVLNDEGVSLFARLTARRAGSAIMLPKPGGRGRWNKSEQDRPLHAAAARAKLEHVNFHALRHTYASHAVMAGAPLLVVAKNLGHSNTRMVEKHYGHLSQSFIADAIRAAAPRFNIDDDSNIVRINQG